MTHTKEVRDFIVANFLFGDGAWLQDDTSFLESGVVDSTGMLELVTFLESTYGIHIEQKEMLPENLDSVQRVSRFLTKKVNAVPA